VCCRTRHPRPGCETATSQRVLTSSAMRGGWPISRWRRPCSGHGCKRALWQRTSGIRPRWERRKGGSSPLRWPTSRVTDWSACERSTVRPPQRANVGTRSSWSAMRMTSSSRAGDLNGSPRQSNRWSNISSGSGAEPSRRPRPASRIAATALIVSARRFGSPGGSFSPDQHRSVSKPAWVRGAPQSKPSHRPGPVMGSNHSTRSFAGGPPSTGMGPVHKPSGKWTGTSRRC
jgi:hypothetical protein